MKRKIRSVFIGGKELGFKTLKVLINKKCYYTSYHTMIDWNGDVFLCPHDWQRRISMGNLMQKAFIDIWNGSLINKYRRNLLCGKRNAKPCSDCNANGTVHGFKHSEAWIKSLKQLP